MDQKLHRIYVNVTTATQWYAVMQECRSWFGKHWKSQSRVKRKLTNKSALVVWFDVPDTRFAAWISMKYSLQVGREPQHQTGK